MLAVSGLQIVFCFSNVKTIAGAARELVDNSGRKITWNFVLEIKQGAQSDGCFGNNFHFGIREVLLK